MKKKSKITNEQISFGSKFFHRDDLFSKNVKQWLITRPILASDFITNAAYSQKTKEKKNQKVHPYINNNNHNKNHNNNNNNQSITLIQIQNVAIKARKLHQLLSIT